MFGGKHQRLILSFVFVGVLLPASSHAVTIKEMADLQLQVKKKEMNDALEAKSAEKADVPPVEQQPYSPPNLPALEKDDSFDIKLVAVYGLNDDLLADVIYDGAVFSLKKGDQVAGWKVQRVMFSNLEIEKNGKRRNLTLSIKPVASLPPAMNTNPPAAGMVPPLPSY